jgi:hypothetical protein
MDYLIPMWEVKWVEHPPQRKRLSHKLLCQHWVMSAFKVPSVTALGRGHVAVRDGQIRYLRVWTRH